MSNLQAWRQALELLPGDEARELEALMQRRAERIAQRAQTAAPRGKRAATPKAASPQPVPETAPRQPDNRIYYVSSDPNDKLADFRSKARPGDAQPVWVDGV